METERAKFVLIKDGIQLERFEIIYGCMEAKMVQWNWKHFRHTLHCIGAVSCSTLNMHGIVCLYVRPANRRQYTIFEIGNTKYG